MYWVLSALKFILFAAQLRLSCKSWKATADPSPGSEMGFYPTVTFGCTDFLCSFSAQHPRKIARDMWRLFSCGLRLVKSCWRNYSASPLPRSLCFDPVASPNIPIIQLGYSAGNPPPSCRAVADGGTKKYRASINGQSIQSLQNRASPAPIKHFSDQTSIYKTRIHSQGKLERNSSPREICAWSPFHLKQRGYRHVLTAERCEHAG